MRYHNMYVVLIRLYNKPIKLIPIRGCISIDKDLSTRNIYYTQNIQFPLQSNNWDYA
jgi:hypothetical protein